MDLLQTIMNAQGGNLIGQVAQRFGLDQDQAVAAVSQLAPALANGVRSNASQPGGLESLLRALGSGQHTRYVEDPEAIQEETAIQEGNGILSHVLGSKDASRAVANQAAEATGISSGILKQMLPVVATMVMGALSKQTAGGSPAQASGLMGFLTPMLDKNQDGSVVDDILGGIGGSLFGRNR